MPLTGYLLKDVVSDFVLYKNFLDALASAFSLVVVSTALPFFPIPVLAFLIIVTFALGMLHPLIGLAAALLISIPMFVYQAPLLAWLFFLFITTSLFLGYKHYRAITFTFLLAALPFSPFGYILEIPIFVLAVLTVGLKRSAIATTVALLIVFVGSGLTNIPNTGPIIFDPSTVSGIISASGAVSLLDPTKPMTTLAQMMPAWSSAFSTFTDFGVTSKIIGGLSLIFVPILYNLPAILMQIVFWLIGIFAISNYAINSRSKYKGTVASLFSIMVPIAYVSTSFFSKSSISAYVFLSYLITPALLFILETNRIDVVRALDVMKSDFRSSFGETFEDLSTGARETFDDIANFDSTKKELRDAVLAPIEHRELAGAYNIRPAKGILLFGPPGTGKTLIMRALANEIRAGFFYVKASSILSPYPGESARELARIFDVAKKHAPSVLFFDEIDGIAGSRDVTQSETNREILSTLLSELDGFQKQSDVVVVGATNMPQLLDQGLMRPGRFDKIIFMPLPDAHGRREIFKYYLKKLPITEHLDYDKLAESTNRFSPADIKNVCDESARIVADVAAAHNKVLAISVDDIMQIIKRTKPSTTLARLEEYGQFKMDYERRTNAERPEQSKDAIHVDDVVGADAAKKALYEAVELPIAHPDLVKKYDVRNVRGILLFGPPGTGKTMLMRAVANEIGVNHVVTISGAEISNYGIERAVATIKREFDRAKENAPSIIFIDEVDSLVPSREAASELGIQMTSEFLEELDGMKDHYNVVLVGTSNRPESIDPALLRPGRFDKLILVPPPDADGRAEIFKKNLSKAPLSADLDYAKLASLTNGYTGADIANICRQAKMNVLERALSKADESSIGMQDIMDLIKTSKPSAPPALINRYASFLSLYGQR